MIFGGVVAYNGFSFKKKVNQVLGTTLADNYISFFIFKDF